MRRTTYPNGSVKPLSYTGITSVVIVLALIWLTPSPAFAGAVRVRDGDDVRSLVDIRATAMRTYESVRGRRNIALSIKWYHLRSFSYGNFVWRLDTRADGKIDYTVSIYHDSGSGGWGSCTVRNRRWERLKFGRRATSSDSVVCHIRRGLLVIRKPGRMKAFTTGHHRQDFERDRAPNRGWSMPIQL